jgi:hypothetical protein
MTSFFYVVSIAFHTSVRALRKCMNTSRKKFFWLRVEPLVLQVEGSLLQNWCRSWTSYSSRTLAVVTDMHHHTELSFVDEFHPFYLKNSWPMLFFCGACCKRGCHFCTTTAPSFCVPASYCHLPATLQTMSIIVVNLQDNRAVFRIFIAILRFSFDCPFVFHFTNFCTKSENISHLHINLHVRYVVRLTVASRLYCHP